MRSDPDPFRREASPVRPPLVLLTAVGRVRRRLARLAAERGAVRGLLAGLCLACLLLVVRGHVALPWPATLAVPVVLVLAPLLGALAALAVALRGSAALMAAARTADRDAGLADRLATALELCQRGERGALAEACIVDAARRAASVDTCRVGRREWPRGARLLPSLAVLALILALLPPLPVDRAYEAVAGMLSGYGAPSEGAAAVEDEEAGGRRTAELGAREAFRRDAAEAPLPRSSGALGLSSIFKDTQLSRRQPDSHAFLGEADERLKLLERPSSLPDLKQPPGGPGYQLRLRRMQEMVGALGSGGISKREFLDLTDRLRRMGGRAGGDALDRALKEGMDALESGGTKDALASIERALDRLLDESRGGNEDALRPSTRAPESEWGDGLQDLGSDPRDRAERRDGASVGEEHGGDDGAEAGSRGAEPGSGGKGGKRRKDGERPEWASRTDSFVEGMHSAGESEAYDSDIQGQGAPGASRLPFMSVFNEYRRQVEETLVKESVPLEARERVRAYFRSLEE